MRKIKKINGYLIVKFNDRERSEWVGLGTYGIIDAQLYTGHLEIDRGAMEYDDADSLAVAVAQARGLDSEMDITEEAPRYTVVAEIDGHFTETAVDPRAMIVGWKSDLERRIVNRHYPDVNPHTAAHELYGFTVALERLGLMGDENDVVTITPDMFEATKREGFAHAPDGASTAQTYALGLALMEECPRNDCMVFRNTFVMCLELDAQIDLVDGHARRVLESALYKMQCELFQSYLRNYAIECYRKERWQNESATEAADSMSSEKKLHRGDAQ